MGGLKELTPEEKRGMPPKAIRMYNAVREKEQLEDKKLDLLIQTNNPKK